MTQRNFIIEEHSSPDFPGMMFATIADTMMGAVYLLPGSYISNILERGDLDGDAEAVMTLTALEITGSYQARAHRMLDTTPNAVRTVGVDEAAQRMPADPRQFLVDFLPSEQRILQRDGLHLLHIRYWSGGLRRLMAQESRKCTLEYDPRDLSRVFVMTDDGIIEARPADLTPPAITLWKHRAMRKAGRRAVAEKIILWAIQTQRDLVDSAERPTKAIRRHQARRSHLESGPLINVALALQDPKALPGLRQKAWPCACCPCMLLIDEIHSLQAGALCIKDVVGCVSWFVRCPERHACMPERVAAPILSGSKLSKHESLA